MNQLVTHSTDGVPATLEERRIAAYTLREMAVSLQAEVPRAHGYGNLSEWDDGVLHSVIRLLAIADALEGR